MNTGPHASPPEGTESGRGSPGSGRKIYLASQSPRRRELLAQWGMACELLLPDETEDSEALEAVRAGEAPATYVRRVTRLKLQAAVERMHRRQLPVGPVLCADTTVALGREILGKPASAADARRMLAALAGRKHRVLTAVALWHQGRVHEAVSLSTVEFGPVGPAEIRRYVDTGEPMGKAGAYAIQGRAAQWVRRIAGSHSGIVGLPAFETAQVLRAAGLPVM